MGGRWGCVCAGWRGGCDWIREPLEREADVDQCTKSLCTGFVLGMVEKISLAALIGRVPVYNVEVWVCGEWRRGGNLGISIVEQTIHVAREASSCWRT